jgi:YfiH family protein
VRIVSATAPGHPGADADGIVAGAPGLLVGVVTADCMPVLMLARSRRAVAAVHAGWRGAAAGVLEEAVARLVAEYGVSPDALEVAMGPTVGPCCYEVGPEVLAAFRARTGDVAAGAWAASGERHRLDLRAAASLLLAAAGVRCTTSVGPCTACDVRYRSYRRDGPKAGRQLGFIGWE